MTTTMMLNLFLLIVLFILTGYDVRKWKIPNAIVLPAIVIAVFLSQQYTPLCVVFILGAMLFSRGSIGGGDVKVLALTAAVLGWAGLAVFVGSFLFLNMYRRVSDNFNPLPLMPFVLGATVITQATIWILTCVR